MADITYAQVSADHVVSVGEPGEAITVTVQSGGTVFYGDPNVSSTNNLGSITVGSSATMTNPVSWLRSASSSFVQIVGTPVSSSSSSTASSAVFPTSSTRTIDVTALRAFDATVSMPNTGQSPNQVVEPSVLYDPSAPYLGYEYVMCAAAYPSNNDAFENPLLFLSHDGYNWDPVVNGAATPGGTATPVVPANVQGDAHNSDPYLTRGPDGTYYILWNQFLNATGSGGTGTNGDDWSIKGISAPSLAGSWSSPVTLQHSALATTRPSSPSTLWDGKQWHIYAIEEVTTAPPGGVIHYTAPTLLGAWTKQANPSISFPSGFAGFAGWWHLNAYYIGGAHILLIQDNSGGNSSPHLSAGNLWAVGSYDGGTTWVVPQLPLLSNGGWAYRAAAVPCLTDSGMGLDIWYQTSTSTGAVGGAGYRTTARPYKQFGGVIPPNTQAIQLAKTPTAPYVFGDTATRVDNAASPGTADSGLAYTVTAGTIGISGNAIYGPATGNNKAQVAAGIADGVFTAEFSTVPTSNGFDAFICPRIIDANNFLRFGPSRSGTSGGTTYTFDSYTLQSVVAGAVTNTATWVSQPKNGDVVTVVCRGPHVKTYLNGRLLGSVSWSVLLTGTAFGVQIGASAGTNQARIRNLTARTLVDSD